MVALGVFTLYLVVQIARKIVHKNSMEYKFESADELTLYWPKGRTA